MASTTIPRRPLSRASLVQALPPAARPDLTHSWWFDHRENVLALARIVVVRRRLSDGELAEAVHHASVEASI